MAIDDAGGPNELSGTVSLGEEQTLVEAETGFGMGVYNLKLKFALTVPAYSRAGDYQGTLTLTITPNVPPPPP
jgi:hypothetical protein